MDVPLADLSVKEDPQICFRAANCKSLRHWEALGLDFASYEETWVTIQFPDPWAKSRHLRRRLVDKDFVNLLFKLFCVPKSSEDRKTNRTFNLYISSDRHDLFEEMWEEVESALRRFSEGNSNLDLESRELDAHPFGVGTERDGVCEHLGRVPRRAIFVLRER